ncbi:beta-galactosidase [Anaerobacterium chartisolvens]|uniref:Beta-galactosidase n=1 Tax=Anaerobacterium chartisolvens TaxID=1297424 RepID=A0A369ALN6_9FIRM|nr:beta-galactosidase [Anaerobacterium chartisolvens]RCX09077.1 beta-galactosidase [Anaerobacterium chartisolvens]
MKGYTYVENGIYHIGGEKKLLLASDYPYYRDKKENWEDRLVKLKEANISIVTFYVPWRHHAIKSGDRIVVDLDGKTCGNRDVKFFIELCRQKGLFVLIKPGPFIHAETNYDGLPDYISPDECKGIESMLNSRYQKVPGSRPLPAPLCEGFRDAVRNWFEIVNRELIIPNIYPRGNIIAIQSLNEGMYSNINLSPLDYDYSKSGIKFFTAFLKSKYENIECYNALHEASYESFDSIEPPCSWANPSHINQVLKYLDWSECQAHYIKALYEEYGSLTDLRLPHFANICAYTSGESGMEYWLAKVQPELWRNTFYGFTGWVGAVAYDNSAYNKYLTLAKRQKGPNLEENWGFSILYDSKYRYPIIPYFQTILAIANGATGFNAYTGIGTASWDDNLDSLYDRPYPDCSPISHEGGVGYKYKVLKLLTGYLDRHGNELLNSCTSIAAAYGLYPPYSYAASWDSSKGAWKQMKVNPPRCGIKGLDAFQHNMRALNYDFSIVNLQTCDMDTLLLNPAIVIVGAFFMEESVQLKLAQYVKNGGKLILLREVPQYDEKFQPCTILGEVLFTHSEIKRLEEAPLDVFNESARDIGILAGIPGKQLYTSSSCPIGYKADYYEGTAYFVSYNPFEGGENGDSYLFTHLMRSIARNYDVMAEETQTQVWCHNHNLSDIKHVFILSRSDVTAWHTVKIKNKFEEYDLLKIKLCPKSAAILRIENRCITECIAKGINEYEEVYASVEIHYRDTKLSSETPCDVLFVKEGKNYTMTALEYDFKEFLEQQD